MLLGEFFLPTLLVWGISWMDGWMDAPSGFFECKYCMLTLVETEFSSCEFGVWNVIRSVECGLGF